MVEVTPNVAGTVTSMAVEPNVLVKAGTILFQIDPALYQAKVKQLQAAVAEARQKPEQLKAQVDALSGRSRNGRRSWITFKLFR